MTWQNTLIFEDAVTGITVDALTDILTLDTRMIKQVCLSFKNTGSQSCILRVTSRTKISGSIDTIEVNDIPVTASSIFRYLASKFLAQTILSVRSASAGNSTTYNVEYTMSK